MVGWLADQTTLALHWRRSTDVDPTQQGVTSWRGREFSSSPGKKFRVSRKKFSTFNIPNAKALGILPKGKSYVSAVAEGCYS